MAHPRRRLPDPRLALVAVVLASGALTACDDPTPTEAEPSPAAGLLSPILGLTADVLECPTNLTRYSTGVISALGGTVALGGHRVEVPPGAVLGLTTLTIVEPVSHRMEISVRAGLFEHFTFQAPVTITIDYGRCNRRDVDDEPLTVWHVDETTGAFLEHMGGVDDKEARTVTFTTDHLSGYVIAN